VRLASQNWLGPFFDSALVDLSKFAQQRFFRTGLCPSILKFALRVSTAINEDVRLDMRVKTKELTERQNLR
jgi:hypothetical protein